MILAAIKASIKLILLSIDFLNNRSNIGNNDPVLPNKK